MKTFLIDYTITNINNVIESHTIRIKNCDSELHAKIKLNKYLIKHNKSNNLIINDCFDDSSGIFTILKKVNPFK
jgi:hypothetical protein